MTSSISKPVSRRSVLATAAVLTAARGALPGGAWAGTGDTPEVKGASFGFIALTDASPLIIAKETRAHLQDSLMDIHGRLGNTVIMITHDVDESVFLSDRIVMMTNGPAARIGQILDIDLPRPRSRVELADAPYYNHLRAGVLRFLHGHAPAQAAA